MNSKSILGLILMTAALGITMAIIAKSSGLPKSSRRFVDQRLDEEALARMDDEGGGYNPVPAAP